MIKSSIYLSTKILFLVVMLCFGIVNFSVSHDKYEVGLEHGWPFTYLTNEINSFSYPAFIANLLIAFGVSGLLAAACESHLRRYKTFKRFSTRTVLIAMTVFAVLFGFIGNQVIKSLRQTMVIRRLEESGGQVRVGRIATRFQNLYESVDPRLGGIPSVVEVQNGDLRDSRLLPRDVFGEVYHLNIMNSSLSDETFESIRKLSSLKLLCVSYSPGHPVLEARNVEALNSLHQLETLELRGCDLRSVNFKALESLGSLKTLSLFKSVVDDRQMEAIAELPKLSDIVLSGTNISNNGLKNLANSKSLQGIVVKGTLVTKSSIEEFRQLKPHIYIR